MREMISPLMQQYLEIKKNYNEELVFFQVGDFYELFFEDAKKAAQLLSITLTKRGLFKGEHIPLCGIPVHMIEQYYSKLVKKGYIVVICNQVEAAQVGKLVQRAVVDIITPSTIFIDDIYDNIYSLFIIIQEDYITVFWFEFGQQEIVYAFYNNTIDGIILFKSSFEKYKPKEIITNIESIDKLYEIIPYKKSIKSFDFINDSLDFNIFLEKHGLSVFFKNISILFLSYLDRYFNNLMSSNRLLLKEDVFSNYLFLDDSTIKYLECVNNLDNGDKEDTLYELLDQTKTKMGSRLLKKWVLYPLCNKEAIVNRQNSIEFFLNMQLVSKEIEEYLSELGDIEKLFQRIRLLKLRDKDFLVLYQFQENYLAFKNYIFSLNIPYLFSLINFSIPDSILSLLEKSININKDIKINDNLIIINPDFDDVLKTKYYLVNNSEEEIEKFCQIERELTGITELVIKKTPMYQYVFELSKIKEKKYTLPDDYIRVQTLMQKERYSSLKLQNLSCEIIAAQDEYNIEENRIKKYIINEINNNIHSFFIFIDSISQLDIFLSLSNVAREQQWTKPVIVEKGKELQIELGKHPVANKKTMSYIANSLSLKDKNKTYIITGPNMGGKSTFMRQSALLVLLSHIGSFIPASLSKIPIMEKILTRVGASDNLHKSKSTFFTELEEIKNILIAANSYSFIIIDEIGRGTSTNDGVALAASVIEYLILKNPYLLCSTHYHELESVLKSEKINWYYMDAVIKNGTISFLYTLVSGKSDHSMGILLAEKIGIPREVIDQAKIYFKMMEDKFFQNILKVDYVENEEKILLSKKSDFLLKQFFKNRDINDVSPKEAYFLLEEIYTFYRN
jgi:DNA mismatch repair protein MutS